MKRFIHLILCVMFLSSISIGTKAQTKEMDFFDKENLTKEEQCTNHRIVYFKLINIKSEQRQQEVLKILYRDSRIFNIKIKDLGSCYAEIRKDLSPLEIRDLINPISVDFDFTSLKVFDPTVICSDLPKEFPVFQDTGDPKNDKSNYQNNFLNWIEKNSEVWNNCMNF